MSIKLITPEGSQGTVGEKELIAMIEWHLNEIRRTINLYASDKHEFKLSLIARDINDDDALIYISEEMNNCRQPLELALAIIGKMATSGDIPPPSAEIVITRPSYATSAPCLDITCTSDDARAWLESVAPIYGQLIAPLSKFNAYRLIVSAAYNADDVEKFLKAQGKL
jgi:hypothetical protein